MTSSVLLTVLLSALVITPCVVNLIVWVYVLAMALIMRRGTSGETEASQISARYGLVFHDDLMKVVSGSNSAQAKSFFGALALLVLWFFVSPANDMPHVKLLLAILLLISLGMLVLNRVFNVLTQLAVRTQVSVTAKLKLAMKTGMLLHIVVLLLTFVVYWVLML